MNDGAYSVSERIDSNTDNLTTDNQQEKKNSGYMTMPTVIPFQPSYEAIKNNPNFWDEQYAAMEAMVMVCSLVAIMFAGVYLYAKKQEAKQEKIVQEKQQL